jgi:hypothetical protein
MSLNEQEKNASEANLHPPNFVKASDYKTIYTNFVQFGVTAFDISFLLGETAGVNEDDGFVVDLKARAVMSPAEAKVVWIFLGSTIQQYEKKFGPIVVPAVALPPEVAGDKTEGV